MKNRKSEIYFIALIMLVVLVLVGLTWANYQFVMQNPGGNDFIPRWIGTRLFLMEGLSPYSEEVSQEIQEMIFSRSETRGEDKSLFVYPFYSAYIFAPFALISDYNTARAIWMTILEISVIAITVASLSLSRWRIRPVTLVVLLVFSLLWYHGIRPLISGNAVTLIALFITGAFLAIRAKMDSLAGFLLALSTIKPQIVVLIIPFIFLWAISQKRWILIWSTLGVLALLIASTSLFIPDWIMQNLRQIVSYPGYTFTGTPGAILQEWVPGVGTQLGWFFSILMAGILIWEWRAAWGKDFQWFFWTACLTLVITNLIGIRAETANYIILFPVLVLIFASWDKHWGVFGRVIIDFSFLLLFFGLWWLFLSSIRDYYDQAAQSPLMFFTLPILLLIGLYWIRWWVLRPEKPWLDKLNKSRNGTALS